MRDTDNPMDDFLQDDDDYVTPAGNHVSGAWPALAIGAVALGMAAIMAAWSYL